MGCLDCHTKYLCETMSMQANSYFKSTNKKSVKIYVPLSKATSCGIFFIHVFPNITSYSLLLFPASTFVTRSTHIYSRIRNRFDKLSALCPHRISESTVYATHINSVALFKMYFTKKTIIF